MHFLEYYSKLSCLNEAVNDYRSFISSIKSPEELLNWMKKNITYHLEIEDYDIEVPDERPTQSGEEIFSSKNGHCAEQSYLEKDVLENLGYKPKLVCVKENDSDQDYDYYGCTHVFVVYPEDDKYVWFENAMHRETGIHEYNSLEELFADFAKKWRKGEKESDTLEFRYIDEISGIGNAELAKKCHRYPIIFSADISNNKLEESLTEGVTNVIFSLSSDDILKKSNIAQISKAPAGPSFILPDGNFITTSNEEKYHNFIIAEIVNKITGSSLDGYYKGADTDRIYDDILDYLIDTLGWVKANSGSNFTENRSYFVIPQKSSNKLTNLQYYAIEEVLENIERENINSDVQIFAGESGIENKYSLRDNTPEDIIKKIRRYYSSGYFIENVLAEVYPNEKESTKYFYKSICKRIKAEVDKYETDEYKNGEGPYGNQNCMLCTLAAEDQIRGNNTLPRPVFSPNDIIFKKDFFKNEKKIKFNSPEDLTDKINDGERYYIHVNWAGSRSGHEFIVIKIADKAYVLDAQSDVFTPIDSEEGKKYFEINYDNSFAIRFDNRDLSDLLKYNDMKYFLPYNDERDGDGLNESLLEVYPNKGESKKDFISRFMRVTKDEYPDVKQRFAVANSYWDRRHKYLKESIEYKPIEKEATFEKFREKAHETFGDSLIDDYSFEEDSGYMKEIYKDGNLIGYVGFSEYAGSDNDEFNKALGLGNFIILDKGKGLGTEVIKDIINKYKNTFDLIYCFVDANNTGAIKLYRRLGTVHDEYGPNDKNEYYVVFYDKNNLE